MRLVAIEGIRRSMSRRIREDQIGGAVSDGGSLQPGTRSKRLKPTHEVIARDEFSCDSVLAAAKSSSPEDADHILRGACVTKLTDDGASWIYQVPGWFKRLYNATRAEGQPEYREWMNEVWSLHPKHQDSIMMFGKEVMMPRFQQVYGQSYRFSGKLFEAEPFPQLLAHAVRCMQDLVVHPETGETYLKAGLVNWYANGDNYMGPHSDDENNIYTQSPVLSLSLGASRRFVFTPRTNKNGTSSAQKFEISLNDGDLLVMGGTTQTTHKHALPKMKKCLGKRISITLRCFK